MTSETIGREDPQWTVGDRLRKARESAGLDQQQLADAVGISRASVVNYEKGHTKPRVVVLKQWALACGVREDWLSGETHRYSPARHLTLVRGDEGPDMVSERLCLTG